MVADWPLATTDFYTLAWAMEEGLAISTEPLAMRRISPRGWEKCCGLASPAMGLSRCRAAIRLWPLRRARRKRFGFTACGIRFAFRLIMPPGICGLEM